MTDCLVGRDELVARIKQHLLVDESAALALEGLPGAGKTRLALELANDSDIRNHFKDGVLWVGLGRQPDLIHLLGSWAEPLGHDVSQFKTEAQLAAVIKNTLDNLQMLLIIDDAWDIETARSFKLGGENCTHIVTTRVAEVASGFTTHKLIEVNELNETDGLSLLELLASDVVQNEPDEAKLLVKLVGGLPLALNLIGNHLRFQSSSHQSAWLKHALVQLRQVEDRLLLGERGGLLELHPSLPGREISLIAVIGVSEDALDLETKNTLRAVSLFPPKPNTFFEQAALAVGAATTEQLKTLVNYGLVESAGEQRYTLHQVIADYGRVQLTDKAASQRLVQFFETYVTNHRTDYELLATEQANIFEAASTARKIDNNQAFLSIIRNLTVEGYMDNRGHTSVLLQHLDDAIEIAQQMGTSQLENLHYFLSKRGNAYVDYGDRINASLCYRKAGELAHELGMADREALALYSISGRLAEEARAALEKLENIALNVPAEERESVRALLLEQRGYQAQLHGNHQTAREFYAQVAEIAERNNDVYGHFQAHLNLGAAELELGNYETSLLHLQKALEIARTVDAKQMITDALFAMGGVYHRKDEHDQAKQYLSAAFILFKDINALGKAEEVQNEFEKFGYQPHSFPPNH